MKQRNPYHRELLRIMRADADEIADALTPEDLAAAQARLDPSECHFAAIQCYWGEMPGYTRRRVLGEHIRLRKLADELE